MCQCRQIEKLVKVMNFHVPTSFNAWIPFVAETKLTTCFTKNCDYYLYLLVRRYPFSSKTFGITAKQPRGSVYEVCHKNFSFKLSFNAMSDFSFLCKAFGLSTFNYKMINLKQNYCTQIKNILPTLVGLKCLE